MSADDYLAALAAIGIPQTLPVHELDRQAAELLRINERTARRYRRGKTAIPGPVEAALNCLAASKQPR